MGFIKHALIGIALYEAVKYFLGKEDLRVVHALEGAKSGSTPRQKLREENVDIIAGASQTGHLKRMKENAAIDQASANDAVAPVNTPGLVSQNSDADLEVGTNPEAPLTGQQSANDQDDPWKNSLANDDLRAPDS